MRMLDFRFGIWAWRNLSCATRGSSISLLALITLSAMLLPGRAIAHAGGEPVLTDEPAGPYRVFAWIQPTPPRVGTVHLDVALTLAPSSDAPANSLVEPVTDAQVTVTFTPESRPDQAVQVVASPQTALNGFYYEIETRLGYEDIWRISVGAQGAAGAGEALFQRQVFAARQVDWMVVAGASLGLFALIGLVGIWNRLQAKEQV